MKDRFNKLLIALCDEGADFIIAGGVAAVIQGVERVTLDLDLSLSFASDSVRSFLSVMHKFGLTPMLPVNPSIIADADARKAMVEEKNAIVFSFRDLNDPYWHVDVFLRDDLAFDQLKASCEMKDIDGRSLKVLSREKLLKLKQAIDPPRPKDRMDIEELIRLIEIEKHEC